MEINEEREKNIINAKPEDYLIHALSRDERIIETIQIPLSKPPFGLPTLSHALLEQCKKKPSTDICNGSINHFFVDIYIY